MYGIARTRDDGGWELLCEGFQETAFHETHERSGRQQINANVSTFDQVSEAEKFATFFSNRERSAIVVEIRRSGYVTSFAEPIPS